MNQWGCLQYKNTLRWLGAVGSCVLELQVGFISKKVKDIRQAISLKSVYISRVAVFDWDECSKNVIHMFK